MMRSNYNPTGDIRELMRLMNAISRGLSIPRQPKQVDATAARAAARAASDAAAADSDAALRIEVVEALVASGVARPVAVERTNTIAKLLAEGERLDLC